jgi:hypothetical protein
VNATLRGLAGVALVLTVAASAAAQTAPVPDDVAFNAARERFVLGARLLREGKREHDATKLERAYLEFRQGIVVYPRSKPGLLDLVESELATNRTLDAMKHLREYVRLHGRPDSGEYKTNFDQQWDIAFQATGHVHVAAPPNGRVIIDGRDEAGIAPLPDPVDVPPGHHRIEALGLSEPLRTEVDASAGAVVNAVLTLAAVAPIPLQAALPAAPPAPTPPTASTGLPDLPEVHTSPPFWRPTRTWGVLVGGVGLAALGTGALFAVQANSDGSRASTIQARTGTSGCSGSGAQSADCQDLSSAYDDQSRDHMLNLVFVGVGAAALVGGVVLFFWPQPSHATTSATTPVLIPTFTPQSAGIQLRGEL